VDTNYTFSADMMTQSRIWLQSVRNVSYNNALDKGKIPRQNPMTVEDAFLLATRQGALAVRRDDIGVLKVGAKADIVCFDGGAPNMAGWTDPVAAVILHANAGDVRDVLVNGRFVKRSGELVLRDGDWESFRGRFVEIARRIHRENPEPQAYPEKFMGRGEWIVPEVMSTRAGGK
jgi:cytosine/adenosine deaminase-related metal-dependent hydrolase